MRPAVKVARIAGASRHSRLETEPTHKVVSGVLVGIGSVSSRYRECIGLVSGTASGYREV